MDNPVQVTERLHVAKLALLAIVLLAVTLWLIVQGFRWLLKRSRQKELARYAPELLQYHDVPGPVAAMIVDQREQLETAARLMRDMMADDVFYVPSVHADPMQEWLDNNKPRRLNK